MALAAARRYPIPCVSPFSDVPRPVSRPLLTPSPRRLCQARLGSTIGYDTLASAAHGAGVAINAHHYSLWLEASLRRYRGATARLDPPFLRLNTDPDRAIAVAFAFASDGSPSQTLPSVYAPASGQGGIGSSSRRGEEGPNDDSVGEGREELASRGNNSRRRRRGGGGLSVVVRKEYVGQGLKREAPGFREGYLSFRTHVAEGRWIW